MLQCRTCCKVCRVTGNCVSLVDPTEGVPQTNEVSLHFQISYGVMIQNQTGAWLAPLGNFHDIARLRKMPKGARPVPGCFSNLRVSATPKPLKAHVKPS